MSRQRADRPAGDWPQRVDFRSYEGPLAGPDPAELEPVPIAEQARRPRLVPAWLVLVALLLSCSAAVAAALWWHHRSRVIEVSNRVQPHYTTGADASGCPTLGSCQVRADVGQPLNVLARRLFPGATVVSSLSVVRSDTGRTVWTTIVLRSPSGLDVSAIAQCVPGAGPITGRAEPLPPVGPAQADFVVAGAPGCSVAVAAQIPRAVPVPLTELRRLAGDRQVQLSP
jgi:hypothetical protein